MMETLTPHETEERIEDFCRRFKTLEDEIAKVIVGNEAVIRGILFSLLGRGHVLLEGIPGVGKTRIVRTLSDVLHLDFSRIQFTPDLMPGDILGSHVVYESEDGRKTLDFKQGPIFAHIVLADEINRATPKTQSALLEAMQERSVTVGDKTHVLDDPFFVLATQNPLEMEGTYPLPEAQLDRFFFKLKVEYPDAEGLHTIMDRTTRSEEPQANQIVTDREVLEMRETVRSVPIARPVQDYAIRLTLATQPPHPTAPETIRRFVRYGSSPRGTQALVVAGKVNALIEGRTYVACEDIQAVAMPSLRHRLLLNFEGEAERVDPDDLLRELLKTVPQQ